MNNVTENGLTPTPKDDKTIRQIKKDFIKNASLLLEDDLRTLTGQQIGDEIQAQGEHHLGSRKHMVEVLLTLIKAETDIQKIAVKNTADILKAMSEGNLNVRDAKEMVALLAVINGDESPDDKNKIIIEIARGEAS